LGPGVGGLVRVQRGQLPALPRQLPALPRQLPALPRQLPALPRQFERSVKIKVERRASGAARASGGLRKQS